MKPQFAAAAAILAAVPLLSSTGCQADNATASVASGQPGTTEIKCVGRNWLTISDPKQGSTTAVQDGASGLTVSGAACLRGAYSVWAFHYTSSSSRLVFAYRVRTGGVGPITTRSGNFRWHDPSIGEPGKPNKISHILFVLASPACQMHLIGERAATVTLAYLSAHCKAVTTRTIRVVHPPGA